MSGLSGVLGVLGPGGGGGGTLVGVGGWLGSQCWGHFSTLHSRLLSDQTQLKDDVDMLRRENGQLLRERNLLQQSWEDMKRLHEEDQKEIGDLRAQQQQVQPGWAAGADQGQASTRSQSDYQPPSTYSSAHLPTYCLTHPPTHHPSIHLPTHPPITRHLSMRLSTYHLLIHHPRIRVIT